MRLHCYKIQVYLALRRHFYHNHGALGSQAIYSFHNGLVFEKFIHIAGNALVYLDTTHCVVLFGLGNFTDFSKSHKFTGEDIEDTSRAGLELFAGCKLPMHGVTFWRGPQM